MESTRYFKVSLSGFLTISRDKQVKLLFKRVNDPDEMLQVYTAILSRVDAVMDMQAAGFIDVESLDIAEKPEHLINLHQIGYSSQNRAGEFGAASSMSHSSHRSIFLKMPGFPVILYR